ncbi:hypothetical protein WG909_13020 [Peptostreptococcaceae bacterium AGR-M142]
MLGISIKKLTKKQVIKKVSLKIKESRLAAEKEQTKLENEYQKELNKLKKDLKHLKRANTHNQMAYENIRIRNALKEDLIISLKTRNFALSEDVEFYKNRIDYLQKNLKVISESEGKYIKKFESLRNSNLNLAKQFFKNLITF